MAKCTHNWIASEGRTASGVICSKCWDYNGPQPFVKPKLKVLPNPYQSCVKLWEFKNKRRALEGLEPVDFEFTKHYPAHEVVYNRPGYYLTPDDCWLEFDMGDGVIKAIAYEREHFIHELKEKNHDEKPMNSEDWLLVRRLLDRGIIPWNDKLNAESWRQQRKLMFIDSGKRLVAMKKRIRQKIQEKKNG